MHYTLQQQPRQQRHALVVACYIYSHHTKNGAKYKYATKFILLLFVTRNASTVHWNEHTCVCGIRDKLSF